MIRFFAQGDPCGQPRQRVGMLNGHARTFTPKTRKRADGSRVELPIWNWKSCIAAAAREFLPATPLQGPLCVDITFYFPRPRSHYFTGKRAGVLRPDAPMFHFKKPDRDNCDKAVLDALTTLGMWGDDAQAVSGTILKKYADDKPGAWICIEPAEAPAPGLVMMEI